MSIKKAVEAVMQALAPSALLKKLKKLRQKKYLLGGRLSLRLEALLL